MCTRTIVAVLDLKVLLLNCILLPLMPLFSALIGGYEAEAKLLHCIDIINQIEIFPWMTNFNLNVYAYPFQLILWVVLLEYQKYRNHNGFIVLLFETNQKPLLLLNLICHV